MNRGSIAEGKASDGKLTDSEERVGAIVVIAAEEAVAAAALTDDEDALIL